MADRAAKAALFTEFAAIDTKALSGAELADRLDEIPRDSDVVAYCRGDYCVLARDAVRLLNQRGYQARRAEDGALEWRIAGLLTANGAA